MLRKLSPEVCYRNLGQILRLLKYFISFNSFSSYDNSFRLILLLYLYYRLENWDKKILKVINLVNTCVPSHFSHVQLFATMWTATSQAPLSMGLSRKEYWSGLLCPPPGFFLTQGSKQHLLCLLHWQVGSLPLLPPGKPHPYWITILKRTICNKELHQV